MSATWERLDLKQTLAFRFEGEGVGVDIQIERAELQRALRAPSGAVGAWVQVAVPASRRASPHALSWWTAADGPRPLIALAPARDALDMGFHFRGAIAGLPVEPLLLSLVSLPGGGGSGFCYPALTLELKRAFEGAPR